MRHKLGANTKVSLIVCLACMVYFGSIYYPKYKQKGTEATLSWDSLGYYTYLPATFIYKDLKEAKFLKDIIKKYGGSPYNDQLFDYKGKRVMKYSAGQAVHYLPWFFLGHFAAKTLDYPTDGYSYPYQMSISLGMMCYAFMGLFFLALILSKYFTDHVTAAVIASIVIGTNYLEYGAISNAMTHANLFTNCCLLIYLSHQFYKNPKWWKAILIGAIIGLSALTRPTEIIIALIPLLWGINPFVHKDRVDRINFIKLHFPKFLIAILSCILMGSIQLFYWKYASGEFLVYSYEEQGFTWLPPHIDHFLFSYNNGWMIYTPIMSLGIIGLLFLRNKLKSAFVIILVALLCLYIASAWDIWWYGGSVSQRAMVQVYPLFAFGMAACFEKLFRHKLSFFLTAGFILFAMYYNIWLTHQAHRGGQLKPGKMTKAYFWDIFLKKDIDPQSVKLLDAAEIYRGNPQNFTQIYSENFDSITNTNTKLPTGIIMEKENQFSPSWKVAMPTTNQNWLKSSAIVQIADKQYEDWAMAQFVTKFLYQGKTIKSSYIRAERFLEANSISEIYNEVKIPNQEIDTIMLYFWSPANKKPLAVKKVEVELFNG